tara:strand:- start:608 stop:970 length:363 start_codon:yes stop_codon:yes gene_type:complete
MYYNKLLQLIICFCVFVFVVSCEKEELTKAIIVVVDNQNNRVDGATVTLSLPIVGSGIQQLNTTDTKITDLNGETEHVFVNEAIMNINVYKVLAPNDTIKGQNVIALQKGSTIEKKVEIY